MIDPILLFFVGLAAFLSYKLFSVLGTRGGAEQKVAERLRTHLSQTEKEETEAPLTMPEEPVEKPKAPAPAWAEKVIEHYPGFDHARFVDGAKSAYEMIVQGFARGDLDRIRPFVDPSVMRTFEIAVKGRENAGQTMDVTFVGIEKAEVVSAGKRSDHIEIVVEYRSDQIRVMRDGDGNIVDGDPNRIDLVRDRWTYSRPAGSTDPNWVLSATENAAN